MVIPRQTLKTTMPLHNAAVGAGRPPTLHKVSLRVRVRDLAERTLLDKHAPACVVINAEGDVLYIHGRTGRYLEPAVGEPSGSILKMAREGLRRELAAGIRKALTQTEAVRYERLRVRTNGGMSLVNLTIEPKSGPDPVKGVLLVLFEDVPATGDLVGAPAVESLADGEQRIADLDRELSAKEEYLRAPVEELETANEELESTNEEMQSSNEELQSTNEELQSINEELVTVNSELQQTVVELSRANDDISNMFAGTGIGTLFVDQHLLIRRFTPTVTAIMNLIPADVGRPLNDITLRLKDDSGLVSAANTVLDTLEMVEAQVETGDGRMYHMRAQPYRTLDNVIEGAVLTFADVTEQQRLQSQLGELARAAAEAGEFAQIVLDTVREPQLVLDGELTVVTANEILLATFDQARDALFGRPLGEVDGGAWHSPDPLELLLKVLPKTKKLGDYGLRLAGGSLGPCTVTLNALELIQNPEKRRLMLLTVTDIERDA
jgi:two-component system CheB/CheR fusion protein